MSLRALQAGLKGKVALVTGASSGLGWATALAFAAEGVIVVGTARREARLRDLAAAIGSRGVQRAMVAGDASDPATAKEAVELCYSHFGRLDFLINNAGVGNYKQLVDTSVAEYDEIMSANMRSSFVFAHAAAPRMIRQRSGTMVFVSSVAGLRGTGNEAVYSASKFAQVGFAEALDEELRPFGIKVCALCPGGMKTEFAVGRGRTEEGVTKSKMMDPAEVADAILFACMQPENVRLIQATLRNMG